MIANFLKNRITPVTLKQLVLAGSQQPHSYVNHSLRHELLVRLAHQIKRLEALPSVRPIEQLLRVHTDTFDSIRLTSISSNPNRDLHRCLTAVQDRHVSNVETLMEGKIMMKNDEPEIFRIIDEFLKVHIGFLLLVRQFVLTANTMNQHGISNTTSTSTESSSIVGIVDTKCDIKSIVADAADESSTITERHMESTPDVLIESVGVPYDVHCVPSHVHHIIFEVMKNALKATASFHKNVNVMLPPVRIRVVWGKSEVCIIIEDEGGGMSRSTAFKSFQYLYTSSETYADVEEKHRAIHSFQPVLDPLSGMGIGLSVSRLFASHFGGDLTMQSYEGYGTTVALYIPTQDIPENIPLSWQKES